MGITLGCNNLNLDVGFIKVIFMSSRGRIQAVYPEGHCSVYLYQCRGEDGLFSFPVEWRYHMGILENEGDLRGRQIEYDDGVEPPRVRFLD